MTGGATRRERPRPLTGLASASLYLLSLTAAGAAALAWHPGAASTDMLVAGAGSLAAALIVGESLREPAARPGGRLRGATASALVLYAALVGVVLFGLFGPPTSRFLERAALGFGGAQLVLLAVPGLGPGRLLALVNALLLTLLAAAAGGTLAAAAATGFAALLVLFLAFEHHARVLGAYRCDESGVAALVAARALPRAAVVALGMTLVFAASPPTPLPGVLAGTTGIGADKDALAEAQARLAVIGTVGAALVYAADRLLRRRTRRPPPQVERLVAERGAEEPLPEPPARGAAAGSDARRRIAQVYGAFLSTAVARGAVRRPGSTPAELAARIRTSPGPLAALTRIFSDARYGRREPTPDEVSSAELAAHAATEGLPPG